MIQVEVRTVLDPVGRRAVLVQLEHGWVTMIPAAARRVADLIHDAADHCDADMVESEVVE